jgi:NAD(P)H-dependent FMN reductase
MTFQPRLLAFAGSLRAGSYNKKLVKIAAAAARSAGAEVTYLDLRELPLPIFDGDLEDREGLPPNGRKLKDLMLAQHGFLISCPEYNSSITAALKNAIDWASRPVEGEPPLACFAGKVVGLMSASPGALGGLRGLFHVRDILLNINAIVLPRQVAVSKADQAFNADGALRDAKQQQAVEEIGRTVARVAERLHG